MKQNLDSQIVIYKTADGKMQLDVTLQADTLWLSLDHIARLFDRDKSVISKHITNIYEEGELSETSTVAKNATVQKEGNRQVKRTIDYYNLDVIISVGYRVNSKRGTQFRIWATNTLRQHIVKGYTINEKRLKGLEQLFTFWRKTDYYTSLMVLSGYRIVCW